VGNFDRRRVRFGNGNGGLVLAPFALPATAVSNYTIPVANCPNIREYFNGSTVNFIVSGRARKATNKTLQATGTATITFDK